MSVSDDVSYLSRFLVKFVEIIAAGLATALSGYLIAHLSGVLSSPASAPATANIQVAPNANVLSSVPANLGVAVRQKVDAPAAQAVRSQQEVNAPPVVQSGRNSVTATKATLPHKQIEITTSARESKQDQRSLVARVRAALGNADRTDSLNVPNQNGVSGGPAAVASQPVLVGDPSASIAVPPSGATELRSTTVRQAPIEPNPLTTVEIQSRPVTGMQSSSAPSPVKEDGLSPLEQMLRHDPLAGSDDVPRPPMPVGQ
jgi:hypothetical protein